MADLWGLGEGVIPHQANWQVRGIPNAAQAARIAAGEYIEGLWYGPMQQEPYRSSSSLEDMLSVMDRWNAFMPEMSCMRMPFNINNWGEYGTPYHGDHMLASTETFLAAMKERNIKIHWVLMDGPSQRDSSEISHPTVHTEANWMAWAAAVNARQIATHQKRLAWCAANPDKAPDAWASEAINEPDSYAVMGARLNNMALAYAVYAQHNINIYQQVYAPPTAPEQESWFFIGGFNYSANFEALARPNPNVPGGISPIQHIRNNIPAHRLCWSMHAYPAWIGGSDRHSARQSLRRRMGGKTPVGIEGDRINITEINARHDVIYSYPIIQDQWAAYNVNENAQWFAEMGIGYGWWTGGNYAQARLIQIQNGLAGVRMEEPWSYALFHKVVSAGNNPLYSVGRQFGEIPPSVDQSIQRWITTDPDTDERVELDSAGLLGGNREISGIGRILRAHGGRGTCILRGQEGSGNLLYGGDGWNVLYGGTGRCVDFLSLGRGGGVARSPDAVRSIIHGSTHTPSRIFTGSGKASVLLFDNLTNHHQIIVDPQSIFHSVVIGFNPNRDGFGRGDRLSFRGQFRSAPDLMNAVSLETPAHTSPGTAALQADLIINFPGGGSFRICEGSRLLATLPALCLDLADGWYQDGWVEAADYDPAELEGPAPDPSDLYFDPLLFDGEAGQGSGGDETGGIPVFSSGGQVVLRSWSGAAIPLRQSSDAA